MIIPFYFFSNTFQLDFHELITPKNEDEAENCRRILALNEIAERSNSSFTVFAKTSAKKHYIGATFNVEQLNEVSSRYFRVARCGGRTPTQISVVFVLPYGERMYINKALLTEIVRGVFTKQTWNEQNITPPRYGSVELEMNENECKSILVPIRLKYCSVDEMLNKFNSVLAARKGKSLNVVLSFLQRSRSNTNKYRSIKVCVDS